jgi:hypothetical protein
MELAILYTVKIVKDLKIAAQEINTLISHYRYASAVRFSLLLNIDTTQRTMDQKGVLYKVESKLPHDKNHFDFYFVTENGAIASTCGDYAEMGFYNRHILALYINGYIDLYPMYQCVSCWFDPSTYQELQSLDTHFTIPVLENHNAVQSFTYHPSLSSPSTAYDFTRSAYESTKSNKQVVNLEVTMSSLPVATVKQMSNKDRCQKALRELNRLKTYTCPSIVDELENLLEKVKLELRKAPSKTTEVKINGVSEMVKAPQLYSIHSGGNTRNKGHDIVGSTSPAKRTWAGAAWDFISPTKRLLSTRSDN